MREVIPIIQKGITPMARKTTSILVPAFKFLSIRQLLTHAPSKAGKRKNCVEVFDKKLLLYGETFVQEKPEFNSPLFKKEPLNREPGTLNLCSYKLQAYQILSGNAIIHGQIRPNYKIG